MLIRALKPVAAPLGTNSRDPALDRRETAHVESFPCTKEAARTDRHRSRHRSESSEQPDAAAMPQVQRRSVEDARDDPGHGAR